MTNMATCIIRRLFSLCSSRSVNVSPPLGNLSCIIFKLTNSTLSKLYYGTRGSDSSEVLSTKAEVRFHVYTADWIPKDVRQKIVEKNKTRINKSGELLVTSEVSRSQQRNLLDCIQKISAIVAEANKRPREPSDEDVALRAARIEKRNQERLRQKKILSSVKNSRRVDFD
uniref:Prokaryotic-type class I peptide chain release factors domain-containing protein n=1 Tax=Poecilia reticulata TaxID=8081 RepID=A0A3P9Q1A7_POERE